MKSQQFVTKRDYQLLLIGRVFGIVAVCVAITIIMPLWGLHVVELKQSLLFFFGAYVPVFWLAPKVAKALDQKKWMYGGIMGMLTAFASLVSLSLFLLFEPLLRNVTKTHLFFSSCSRAIRDLSFMISFGFIPAILMGVGSSVLLFVLVRLVFPAKKLAAHG